MGRPLVVYVIISHNPWGRLPTFQQGKNKLRWITMDIFQKHKMLLIFWLIFCCLSCQRQRFRSILSLTHDNVVRLKQHLTHRRNICQYIWPLLWRPPVLSSSHTSSSAVFLLSFSSCSGTHHLQARTLLSLWGAQEDTMKPVCRC